MPEIIGTLGERSLHAVLKRFLQPDENRHEVRVGRYVADIFDENGVTEIQTRQFYKMKRKLAAFLPEHAVTVVYPVSRQKWISWLDPSTGEAGGHRRSPKTGQKYEIFRELYSIKEYLTHPNLSFKVVMTDVEEYRVLDGWSRDKKRGAHRIERIPVGIGEVYDIACADDYLAFVPPELPEKFTAKQFARAARLSEAVAQRGVNVLRHVGAIELCGSEGRAYLYSRRLPDAVLP